MLQFPFWQREEIGATGKIVNQMFTNLLRNILSPFLSFQLPSFYRLQNKRYGVQ